MSTHALVKIDDIKLYRHFDGYPETTGEDLKDHLHFGDAQSLATILCDTNKYELVEPGDNWYVHYLYEVDLENKTVTGWKACKLKNGSHWGKDRKVYIVGQNVNKCNT